jgi:hypothetical protein
MTEPRRVQLRRTKGWRLPANTAIIDRRSKWGNPWVVTYDRDNGWCVLEPDWLPGPRRRTIFCSSNYTARGMAALRFWRWAVSPFCKLPFHELAGMNVACWCPDGYCHGTAILAIANRSTTDD